MVSLATPQLSTPTRTPLVLRPRWVQAPPLAARDAHAPSTAQQPSQHPTGPAGGPRNTPRPQGRAAPAGTSDGLSDYLEAIGRLPLLSAAEERALIARMHTAPSQRLREAARRELVERNLRLVVAVAKRYAKRPNAMPLDDLIQEGNLGLMRAAERFDPTRGTRFSTAAVWYIRQAIDRAQVDRGRVIRLPLYIQTKRGHYRRLVERQPDWHHATDAAVAAHLDLSAGEVGAVRAPDVAMMSLEQPVPELANDGAAEPLGALVPDPVAESVEDQVVRRIAAEEVLVAMREVLTPKQRDILTLRHLPAGRPFRTAGANTPALAPLRTYDEISALMDPPISRERVRQILDRAERKLRRYLGV